MKCGSVLSWDFSLLQGYNHVIYVYIFEVFYLKYWITFLEELSEEERNASQSSDYYYSSRKEYLTADLAISGTPTDTFGSGACSTTQANP